MSIEQALQKSKDIYKEALDKFNPDGIVAMVSGGNDSAVAYHVAEEIGVDMDYIFHINTGTGVRETTEFVRDYFGDKSPEYVEPDAGDTYEEYVKRKGFIGVGWYAHSIAYHLLKATPLRKAVSKHIRKGRKGVNVLMLNGARKSESENRKINLPNLYNRDPAQQGNVWCNIIHHWSADMCDRYMRNRDIPQNPVTKVLCRSAECLCGTMQSPETRIEVSHHYPEWGTWIDDLRHTVMNEEPKFPWDWGYNQPGWYQQLQQGQMGLFGEHKDFDHQFQPMCKDCTINQ